MAPRLKNPTPPPITVDGEDAAEDADNSAIVVDGEDEAEAQQDAAPSSESVDELRRQLAEQRRRADAAEAERDRINTERTKDQKTLTDSRLLVIESTIKAKEAEKEEILRRIEEAKEAGDYKAETVAIDQLTQVNGDLKSANLGKERLEHDIEQAAAAQQVDPFDRYTQNMPDRARNWLSQHREYVTDPSKNQDLVAAHHAALAERVVEGSDEYYRKVEEFLGLDGRAPEREAADYREPRAAAPAAPAAPVSRAPAGGRGREVAPGVFEVGKDRYQVSREVREAAEIAGIPLKTYIEEAKRLKRGPDGQLH